VFREYVDRVYREQFDEWLKSHRAAVEVLRTKDGFAGEAMPGRRRPFVSESPDEGITVGEVCDPVARTSILEGEGAVAEVLFPGPDFARELGIPFGSTATKFAGTSASLFTSDARAENLELLAAGERAYNRWLADYCSLVPGRAVGLLHPPRHDMEAAVRELVWGRDAGLRGVQIPSDDPRLPAYWDDYWEPMWSACEDLGLPVHFHGGTSHGTEKGLQSGNDAVSRQVVAVEGPFWMGRPLKVLIYAGVLERHPGLNVVFTEFSCDWVPNVLARMNWFYYDTSARATTTQPIVLPRPPSEYWYRQCYVGASLLSRDEVMLRDQIGVDNMMYGVDFPHPEGSWMRTKEWFEQIFGGTGIPETDLAKILGENALRLYGLDADLLGPIAERVGPVYDEIVNANPRTRSAWGDVFAYMPAPYRPAGARPDAKFGEPVFS
jgi:predicted TIM-barrel fold metal-dependent hydrolase